MINRPKLQDLREDDLQLKQVTRDLSSQVNKHQPSPSNPFIMK